jgi:hypothetical protein
MMCRRCGNWTTSDVPGGTTGDSDFVDAMDVTASTFDRIITGGPWDEAWGGGFVPSSVTLLGGPPGIGKALALDTPIATPTGWTTMGAIRVGDRVFDETGEPCTVTWCSPVMRDRECFAVRFSDGEKIVADAEHLWWTHTKGDRAAKRARSKQHLARRRELARAHGGRGAGVRSLDGRAAYNPTLARKQEIKTFQEGAIRTTAQIRASLRIGVHANHSVACAAPLVLATRKLPIDPYMLGVWLGDGTAEAGNYTSADPEIAETLRGLGYVITEHYYGDSGLASRWSVVGLWSILRKVGLFGSKHIPDVYLRASTGQRLSLLQGLMDTAGDCMKHGTCCFNTTLPALRDGVGELLSSLGVKYSLSNRRSILNGVDHGPSWRLCFSTPLRVFMLRRKAIRQKDKLRGVQTRRYIEAVRKVASVPVRCIRVNSPSSLYLAGRRMVPTHNTTMLLQISIKMAEITKKPTYYISAEQDKGELKLTLDRIGLPLERGMLRLLKKMGSGGEINEEAFTKTPPGMLILDSVTALCGKDKEAQVVVAKRYKQYAIKLLAPVFLISHMTKEGDLAGLLTLQHEVDTLMTLFPNDNERSKYCGAPLLEAYKNRYGATRKNHQLIMTPNGLVGAPEEKGKDKKSKDKSFSAGGVGPSGSDDEFDGEDDDDEAEGAEDDSAGEDGDLSHAAMSIAADGNEELDDVTGLPEDKPPPGTFNGSEGRSAWPKVSGKRTSRKSSSGKSDETQEPPKKESIDINGQHLVLLKPADRKKLAAAAKAKASIAKEVLTERLPAKSKKMTEKSSAKLPPRPPFKPQPPDPPTAAERAATTAAAKRAAKSEFKNDALAVLGSLGIRTKKQPKKTVKKTILDA